LIAVVFDTNVLVSAILSPGRAASQAIDLWHAGLVQIAISDDILSEYHAVLNRPKLRLSPEEIRVFLAPFLKHSPTSQPANHLTISPDPSDNRFLECAEAANADFLVTGNLRHFPERHGVTHIVDARTFLSIMAAKT
jgi:uncharacterized protein